MNYNNNKAENVKIAYIGGGSRGWAWGLMSDLARAEDISGEVALYDIDKDRLEESLAMLTAINEKYNAGKANIKIYHGVPNRKDALRGADFVVNAIQVGGYDPATIIDFEVPKKYGLRQTIADTMGIGGILRGGILRDCSCGKAACKCAAEKKG